MSAGLNAYLVPRNTVLYCCGCCPMTRVVSVPFVATSPRCLTCFPPCTKTTTIPDTRPRWYLSRNRLIMVSLASSKNATPPNARTRSVLLQATSQGKGGSCLCSLYYSLVMLSLFLHVYLKYSNATSPLSHGRATASGFHANFLQRSPCYSLSCLRDGNAAYCPSTK